MININTGVDVTLIEIEDIVTTGRPERRPTQGVVELAIALVDKTYEQGNWSGQACVRLLKHADRHHMLTEDVLEKLAGHASYKIKAIAWASEWASDRVLEEAAKKQFDSVESCEGPVATGSQWRALATNPRVIKNHSAVLVGAMRSWADNDMFAAASSLGACIVQTGDDHPGTISLETVREIWEISATKPWVKHAHIATQGRERTRKETGVIWEMALTQKAVSFSDVAERGVPVVRFFYDIMDLGVLEKKGILEEKDWLALARTKLEGGGIGKLASNDSGSMALIKAAEGRPEWVERLPVSLCAQLETGKTVKQLIAEETDPDKLVELAKPVRWPSEKLALIKNPNTPYETAMELAGGLAHWVGYTAREGLDWKAGYLYTVGADIVLAVADYLKGNEDEQERAEEELGFMLDRNKLAEETSLACLQVLRWSYRSEPTTLTATSALRVDVMLEELVKKDHWEKLPWKSLMNASVCNEQIALWATELMRPVLDQPEQRAVFLSLGDDWRGTVSELVNTCTSIVEQ